MEMALNVVWMALAAAMCLLWILHARGDEAPRWIQAISLSLVLAFTFVVVTMYDDIAMAQNPAETRCFQREDDLSHHAHSACHPIVSLAPPDAAPSPVSIPSVVSQDRPPIPAAQVLVLSRIQNRPPPLA